MILGEAFNGFMSQYPQFIKIEIWTLSPIPMLKSNESY
jgi:hypothetical protein